MRYYIQVIIIMTKNSNYRLQHWRLQWRSAHTWAMVAHERPMQWSNMHSLVPSVQVEDGLHKCVFPALWEGSGCWVDALASHIMRRGCSGSEGIKTHKCVVSCRYKLYTNILSNMAASTILSVCTYSNQTNNQPVVPGLGIKGICCLIRMWTLLQLYIPVHWRLVAKWRELSWNHLT